MSERQLHEQQTHVHHSQSNARAILRAHLLIVLAALASLLTLSACSDTRERVETANSTTSPASAINAPSNQPAQSSSPAANSNTSNSNAPASNSQTPAPSPPQPAEIDDKMARVFKGAVESDPAHRSLALVGDFNGDGSEDVAFAVRPTASGLAEINSEVSNWILAEPQKVSPADPHKDSQPPAPPARPKAEAGDQLLAVVHGYGSGGWRNPAAQQTYLLRNALGRGLKVETKQDASYQFNLRFRGDVIAEQLGGAQGVLEWTGATYAWLPEKR
ncbi:MAG: hypothetical protein M3268_07700 [Acidobacteriota bacterium]|nr:hypothetical protein [Acidobacteriota bacterium]